MKSAKPTATATATDNAATMVDEPVLITHQPNGDGK
jgi:hypothetical protein